MPPDAGNQVWSWQPPSPTASNQSGWFTPIVLGRILDNGGTANIHEVDPYPHSKQLIKIYTHAFRDEDKHALFMKFKRIAQNARWLATNVPCAAWPTSIILSAKGQASKDLLLGCRMPAVTNAMALIYFARDPQDLKDEGVVPGATIDTLRQVALNVIVAFQKLHRAGILFGDPNANNILVDLASLKVTFIDVDSFAMEIQENTPQGARKRFLPPPGTTPGFRSTRIIAREQQGKGIGTYEPADDHYVLAIHLFRLLVPGFHPFNHNLADGAAAEAAMLKGQFPYAGPRASMRPCHHLSVFQALPRPVQAAFVDAFAHGQPPTPDAWRALFRTHWGHLQWRP